MYYCIQQYSTVVYVFCPHTSEVYVRGKRLTQSQVPTASIFFAFSGRTDEHFGGMADQRDGYLLRLASRLNPGRLARDAADVARDVVSLRRPRASQPSTFPRGGLAGLSLRDWVAQCRSELPGGVSYEALALAASRGDGIDASTLEEIERDAGRSNVHACTDEAAHEGAVR